MTSNIAESLNRALWEGRGSPIVELLKFIRAMLTRWFSARRTKEGKHMGFVTPEVDKQMKKRMTNVKGSKVGMITSWIFEIVGMLNGKHNVLLDHKRCTCKQYDKDKIPCGHAMFAANTHGIPLDTLVGDFYKTSAWKASYEGIINPEVNAENIEMADEIVYKVLNPPNTRRPSGRPKVARIPSVGEYPKHSSGTAKLQRCSRCKGTGHNRTSCTNPI
ncbi:uncharacterized protein LOC111831053 [Capsella rubella]|uniref:uncharacterized protein LOC111831053 n=1 Tax=Capsella rubella TaxID=81985 RepID=UPI000CD5884C|nr:uncharacterized protein LOC111831053 [Capsella rubella]